MPATALALEEESRAGDLAALDGALAALGDRWSLMLVAALLDGPGRFGELQQRLPGIAPNILSARLRSLEQLGVVVAEPYSRRPPRFLYELTALGQELSGPVRLLADWGARHGGGHPEAGPRHAACGTALEVRRYCPTCDAVLQADGDHGDTEDALYYA
jgi:DNA-binding HxlR family transcriptional regulator